jgi:hypothetical protein
LAQTYFSTQTETEGSEMNQQARSEMNQQARARTVFRAVCEKKVQQREVP